MEGRKGEKIGWIGGFLGGFCWLLLLSIAWFVIGSPKKGLIALGFFIVATIIIECITPWRYPQTKYWKLLVPVYAILTLSFIVCIMLWGGLEKAGLRPLQLFMFSPLLIPFFTIGNKVWEKK